MPNIIDYVETEMQTLDQKSFTEVDSLVLSQFVYIEFKGVVPGIEERARPIRIADALKAEHFSSMFHEVRDTKNNRRLLFAMAASPRFRDFRMAYFVNEIDLNLEKQFSAVTFFLPDNSAYIAFRGTDSTLVGWKEDFNMAFSSTVPAQQHAKRYLNQVAKHLPARIMLGGHSKGGNLAVYTAMTALEKLQRKIVRIFDHDGPGFRPGALDNSGYRAIQEKIRKSVPEAALVGILLENKVTYSVVKSRRIGAMQHDPFSWELRDGEFCFADEIWGISGQFNQALNNWLNSVSDEKRELFIDTFYEILCAGESQTFGDLSRNWSKALPLVFNRAMNLDPEIRKFLTQTIKELAIYSVKKKSG